MERICVVERRSEIDARGRASYLIKFPGEGAQVAGQIIRGTGATLVEALKWAGFLVQESEARS